MSPNVVIAAANVWKSVQVRYAFSACGFVFTASILIGFANGHDVGGAPRISQSAPLSSEQGEARPEAQFVLFVVESELQGTDHLAAFTQDLNPSAGVTYGYQIVTDTEEISAASARTLMAEELVYAGTRFAVMDLRVR